MQAADVDYEKGAYSTIERILYLLVIPIVFSLLLTIGLLHIFGVNVKDAALTMGNKIPIVERWIPEPASKTALDQGRNHSDDLSESQLEELRDLEALLVSEMARSSQYEEEINRLESLIKEMEIQLAATAHSDEQYDEGIKELAIVYAQMTPSRAASIIQNLTLHEQVLLLNEMTLEDQTRILEKMDPVSAAEASILLKDIVLTKDLQIAALQERLALHQGEGNDSPQLSNEELALTFAGMTTDHAATVLLEMIQINEDKVVNILRAMDVQARSQILDAITNLSELDAAQLSVKLG